MSADYLDWCRRHEGEALPVLEELVSIDSGPDNPPGWARVAAVGQRELSNLGLET